MTARRTCECDRDVNAVQNIRVAAVSQSRAGGRGANERIAAVTVFHHRHGAGIIDDVMRRTRATALKRARAGPGGERHVARTAKHRVISVCANHGAGAAAKEVLVHAATCKYGDGQRHRAINVHRHIAGISFRNDNLADVVIFNRLTVNTRRGNQQVHRTITVHLLDRDRVIFIRCGRHATAVGRGVIADVEHQCACTERPTANRDRTGADGADNRRRRRRHYVQRAEVDVHRATDVNGVESKINRDARIYRHVHRRAADGNGDRRADDVSNSKCRHTTLHIQFKAWLAGFVGEGQM